MKDRYYFAYGSNMNLEQMKYRCPAAEDVPAKPSKFYLDGILEGCKDNQIPTESVMEAVKRTRQEVKKAKNRYAR